MQYQYLRTAVSTAKAAIALLVVIAALCALSVSNATASELSNDSAGSNPAGRLIFSVTSNVNNNLTVTRGSSWLEWVSFHDSNSTIVDNTTAGLACTRSDSNHTITCYAALGLLSTVSVGDLAIDTGAGNDTVDISDGASGANPETDTIDLGSGGDTLVADEGSQDVIGGSGIDSISTGSGDDTIDMVDGTADSMTSCGTGTDVINIDAAGGDGNSRCETRNLR